MRGRTEGKDLEGEEGMTKLHQCRLNQTQNIQSILQELARDTPPIKNAIVPQARKVSQSSVKNAINLLMMKPINDIIHS